MKKLIILTISALVTVLAQGAPFKQTFDGYGVGPVRIESADLGGWMLTATRGVGEDGVEEMEIALAAPSPLPPPKLSVFFDFDALDVHHRWVGDERVNLMPNWTEPRTSSRLCSGMPVVAFLNDNDRNRATIACSEAKRRVDIDSGYRDFDMHLEWKMHFFAESEAPLASYRTKIRFDRRDVYFGDAIAAAAKWIGATSGFRPAKVPDAAFNPLYSSWYAFHRDVKDDVIEAECREAAALGMKTVILDDGWQADVSYGYDTCGDWQAAKSRFPDMAAHVAKVHALGMKYMIWYSVPFVGSQSANHQRFKGKYLYDLYGAGVLDPRFPEVRKFLCDTYAKAMREWNLDGFKLDFIDRFDFRGEDPAVKENYAGRDVKSLSEAVDRLMKEVHATLTAIKPDALIEFRQSYVGPGIRQYGNMFRAFDCSGDLMVNRQRIVNLRLTSGDTAVHADMLTWNRDETPEVAARFVLSAIFGVVQYSVGLRDAPAEQKRMIAHWVQFAQDHRDALLRGAFRPRHFEANYPVIESESKAERIIAVYNDLCVAECGAADKPVYVLNATGKATLKLELAAPCAKAEIYDTFGKLVATRSLSAGLQAIAVPTSGYVKLAF